VTTLAVAAVLIVVFTMTSLTWLLARAVRNGTPEHVVYILLGYQMLGRIDVLLPLAFYLGILMTLSRWYRDSEMTVLAACGIGLLDLLRPVMVIGLLFGALVMVAAFYTTPYALGQIERVKAETAHRQESELLAPGVFSESARTGRVFYAENVQENGALEGIFVSSLEQDAQGVMVAKSAHTFIDSKTQDKFIALQDGALYEGEPGLPNYRILEFKVYNLRVEPKAVVDPPAPVDALPNRTLWEQRATPAASAELHWRLGKTLASFVLALFAMAFAYTDFRRGRMSNFFVAVVVYFVYSNLLSMGEAMLKRGTVPGGVGLWWVHAGMVLIAAFLLWQRHCNRPLISLPRGLSHA